jgi:hypothetical protein
VKAVKQKAKIGTHVGAFVPASSPARQPSATQPKNRRYPNGFTGGGNNTGTLNYVWKAGGDQVGTDVKLYGNAADLARSLRWKFTQAWKRNSVQCTYNGMAKKSAR